MNMFAEMKLKSDDRFGFGLVAISRLFAAIAALVLISGCVVGPDFEQPALPELRPDFRAAAPDLSCSNSLQDWNQLFDDPALNYLLDRAKHQNLDLEEAFHRVTAARATVSFARGDLFPDVDATREYQFRKRSSSSQPFVGPNGNSFSFFSAGLNSTWEIDLFGRIRRTIQASAADLEASKEDYEYLKLTLMSDVASAYIRIRVLQQQIAVTRANLNLQRETGDLVQQRQKSGIVTELDVVQSKAFQLRTESDLPEFEKLLQVTFNQLSILLGETPNEELRQFIGAGHPLRAPNMIGVGLPMDLIRKRPDIRRVERQVAAASARIGIAAADLYPQLSLTGTISLDSRDAADLLNASSLAFSVGPSVRWNILQFGRIRSTIEVRKAELEQVVTRYRRTVIKAVAEVEDGLVQHRGDQQRADILERAIVQDRKGIELSMQRYAAGNASFQRIIQSQRRLLRDQQDLAASQGGAALQLVRTFKAIGGGWETCPTGGPVNASQSSASPGSIDLPNAALPNAGSSNSRQPLPPMNEPILQMEAQPKLIPEIGEPASDSTSKQSPKDEASDTLRPRSDIPQQGPASDEQDEIVEEVPLSMSAPGYDPAGISSNWNTPSSKHTDLWNAANSNSQSKLPPHVRSFR